jgi:drug/metabolite transporter (DMT)-like permease
MDLGSVFEQSEEALSSLVAIVVLAIVGTALAVILFNRLVANTSVIFASSVTYIIPIFAAMWGLFFGESLVWMHLVYGLIILFGVYLINRKRPIVGKA